MYNIVTNLNDASCVNAMDILGKVVLIILISVGLLLLKTVLIMLIWNFTMPSIWPQQVPRVTFKQAFGLALFSSVLFGW